VAVVLLGPHLRDPFQKGQVGPGAEGLAPSRQDQSPHPLIGFQLLQGREEAFHHLGREGVSPLWVVQE